MEINKLAAFKNAVSDLLDSGELVINRSAPYPDGNHGLCRALAFDGGGWSYTIITKLRDSSGYMCDFDKDWTEHGVLHEARYCFLYLIDMLTLEEFCEIVNTSDLTPSQEPTAGAQATS